MRHRPHRSRSQRTAGRPAADRGSPGPQDRRTVRPHHPGNLCEDRFIASCRELLSGCRAFSVRYGRIERLPATSILAASPDKEGALLALHDAIAEKWSGALDRWTGDEGWKPHTTLLYDPDGDLAAAEALLRKEFSPFAARVERIEFSRVEETGYTIVDHMDLPA